MTKEQIAKLAKDAGFTDADENSVWITDGFWTLELERFAHLVYEATFRDANIAASRTILDAAVLAEREACAKVVEEADLVEYEHCMVLHTDGHATLRNAAAAIRARGNT